MTRPSRRDLERAVESLRDEADASQSRAWVDISPEQARRLKAAFRAVDEPVDPERLADLFVYGPDESEDVDLTDSEAAAFRTVEWRERFGEAPPWEDSGSGS